MAQIDMIAPKATLGFHVEQGTILIMTAPTSGETHEGRAVTLWPGAVAVVDSIRWSPQGLRVAVTIHAGPSPKTGEDTYIVNVFEAGDVEPRFPFVRADEWVRDALVAMRSVEAWWITDGMNMPGVIGAPAGMFSLRAAIAKAEGRENG
ncbi:hypothetical protein [uncultured Alsobacter sp.]|uniref:hypothetical protein n=1 Tax=uncultured Alsobacter sp. TaxID=1748258 RepID=UPI0025D5EAB1|nr:hypothetical protein [uncultured Alsobacter sp.]